MDLFSLPDVPPSQFFYTWLWPVVICLGALWLYSILEKREVGPKPKWIAVGLVLFFAFLVGLRYCNWMRDPVYPYALSRKSKVFHYTSPLVAIGAGLTIMLIDRAKRRRSQEPAY